MKIDVSKLEDYNSEYILTDTGYEQIIKTISKEEECIEFHFDNYTILKVAISHLFELENGEWISAKELDETHKVKYLDGITSIVNKFNLGVQKVYDMTINSDKHQYYLDGISSHNCGKTTTLAEIFKTIKKTRVNGKSPTINVCAPTHKATNVAKNMLEENNLSGTCSTIHSYLNLRVGYDSDTGAQTLTQSTNTPKKVCDLLIIDEGSMISKELFDYINHEIKLGNCKCILYIADGAQLAPVSTKNDLNNKDNIYLKYSPIFALDFQYRLTEVVRQAADNPIIKESMGIRACIEQEIYPPLVELFNPNNQFNDYKDKIIIKSNYHDFMEDYYNNMNDKIVLGFTNDTVQAYNSTIRRKIMNPNNEIDFPQLVVGEELIFNEVHTDSATKNNIHINTEIVEIKSIEEKYLERTTFQGKYHLEYFYCIDTNDKPFHMLKESSETKWNQYINSLADEAKQANPAERRFKWKNFYDEKALMQDVRYNYASTIHKIQGSTVQDVYIDYQELISAERYLEKDMLFRLIYVALTRASERVILLK